MITWRSKKVKNIFRVQGTGYRVQEGCGENNSMSTHKHRHNHKESGFTLVELSIVIVVIGLIIGAVTAGVSLVKQARVRSVITDSRQYTVAYTAFRLKYDKFPGDMNNATTYFGGATVTTNGNGDRMIENCCTDLDVVAGDPAGYDWSTENSRAWQHLYLSGVLPTAYVGSFLGGTNVDYPKSSYASKNYWSFINNLLDSAGNYYKHNQLGVGPYTVDPFGRIFTSILPVDAFAIDTKLDDGLPRRGHVLSRDGGCGATYDPTSTVACQFGFILGPPAR
jgi:prepilin-type N-terminal cleavage/methylation domain-containing protein